MVIEMFPGFSLSLQPSLHAEPESAVPTGPGCRPE